MINIDMIIHSSDLIIQKQYVCYPEFPNIEYFYICSDEIDSLHQQAVYIGTNEHIRRLLLYSDSSFATLFIVTDYSDEFWKFAQTYQCNLLYIPDKITTIYNKLNTFLASYNHWQYMLEIISIQQINLASFVEASGQMLNCPLFIMNSGYSLIASYYEELPIFSGSIELLQKGFLSIDCVMDLRENSDITLIPIRLGVSVLAFILIPLPKNDYRIQYYIPHLIKKLKSHISINTPSSPSNYRIEFEQLVFDLIEMNINSKEQLEQRMNLANLKLKNYFRCVLVEPSPEKASLPINQMIPYLQSIFSTAYFCIYQRTIVGIIPCNDHDQTDYDSKLLKEYLEEQKAVAGFSSLSFSIDQFRTFYLMCVQAIRFGRIFGTEHGTDNLIFHYEDYRVIHMIDMCKDSFVRTYHHDNLIYLCHPFIIRLYRYDMDHGSNMLHVLGTFLKNNCNLAHTARVLNYHRNTMLNKIQKIEAILCTKLNNNMLNQTLMLSYITLQYISIYLKKDVLKVHSTPNSEFTDEKEDMNT